MSQSVQRPTGASVVLCCHNSAARIACTIGHLARQVVQYDWEVLLVANACSDATVDVARQAWAAAAPQVPLHVVDEPRLGLTLAREAGLARARYGYAVFCDDDNWLDSNYVQTGIEIMEANRHIGVLGGFNDAQSDGPLPGWFWECAGDYAVGRQAPSTGEVTQRGYVWGAGMFLRTCGYDRLRAAGALPLLSDRTGASLASGGDAELCQWFVLAGFALWYDDRLRLKHFVPQQRLTHAYRTRLDEGFRDSWRILGRYRTVVAAHTAPPGRRLGRFLGGLAKSVRGREEGRWTMQAFSPLPWIVVDKLTREIQLMAAAIAASQSSLERARDS
jgi:hypothetical protein